MTNSLRSAAVLVSFVLLVAGGPARAETAPVFQLVESWPVETSLDLPEVPDAHEVWLEMIDGANKSLDFGEFYAASEPGSRLEPVIEAIRRASARGIRVRFLTDKGFYDKDPTTADRLAAIPGVELRTTAAFVELGGVMHCKYFVVDGREAFFGSQNFDWRSITHNQELGIRTSLPGIVTTLAAVFEADWKVAGGETGRVDQAEVPTFRVERVALEGGEVLVQPALSPAGWLPDERNWDLPRLVDLINGAETRIRVQLLNYATVGYGGDLLRTLDTALKRAAVRDVQVEILLANWAVKGKALEDLRALQRTAGITVRIASIPEAATGFVPYARVIHSKFMVVDSAWSWLGTSNWKPGYFFKSRNVGVVVDGAAFARQLDRLFENTWDSEYAAELDPDRDYKAPKIH